MQPSDCTTRHYSLIQPVNEALKTIPLVQAVYMVMLDNAACMEFEADGGSFIIQACYERNLFQLAFAVCDNVD